MGPVRCERRGDPRARPQLRGRVRSPRKDGDRRLRRRLAEPRAAHTVLDRGRPGWDRPSVLPGNVDRARRRDDTLLHRSMTSRPNGSRMKKAWLLCVLALAFVLPATTTSASTSCTDATPDASVTGDLLLAVTGPPDHATAVGVHYIGGDGTPLVARRAVGPRSRERVSGATR